jgi:hypothetical protein
MSVTSKDTSTSILNGCFTPQLAGGAGDLGRPAADSDLEILAFRAGNRCLYLNRRLLRLIRGLEAYPLASIRGRN